MSSGRKGRAKLTGHFESFELETPRTTSRGVKGRLAIDGEQNWTQEEARKFFKGFQQHATDWLSVSRAVHSKSAEMCEMLYRTFKSFLSLPKDLLNEAAFLAVVKDNLKNEGSGSDTVSDMDAEPTVSGGSSRLGHTARSGRPRFVTATEAQANSGEQKTRGESSNSPSPMWGSRRPRASLGSSPAAEIQGRSVARKRAQARLDFGVDGAAAVLTSPPGSSARKGRQGRRADLAGELGDAEGADALLSLAALAEASMSGDFGGGDQMDDAAYAKPESGRPVRSSRRPPRRHQDTDSDYEEELRSPIALQSPPSQPRRLAAKRADMDPLPPRTPSSRSKRQQQKEKVGATPSSYRNPAGSDSFRGENSVSRRYESSAARHSARARRRTRVNDPDYVSRPSVKRSRKDSEAGGGRRRNERWNEQDMEADLEAEMEDLGADDDDEDWFQGRTRPVPRRRRRKSVPEKVPPPPSTVKQKVLFGRRSQLGSLASAARAQLPEHAAVSLGPPVLPTPAPAHQQAAAEAEGQTTKSMVEVQLRRSLDPRVHRWCSFEFFYSALDRPFIMRNELAQYLQHVGIPAGTKLTRAELSLIRASLGRPRRLSLAFLRQERIKLEAYREKVRAKYVEVGPGAEVPADMPRALQVGQKVTARHPHDRQLHDGNVLTVAPNCYRVQFDRRDLGVEMIRDTDVMPSDPTENLPAILLAEMPNIILNGRQPGRSGGPGSARLSWTEQQAKLAAARGLQDPASVGQASSSLRAMAEMKGALDKKDLLVAKLKKMNDEVDMGMHKEVDGQRPEPFQKAYAQVLMELQAVSKLLETTATEVQSAARSDGSVPAARLASAPTELSSRLAPVMHAPLAGMAAQADSAPRVGWEEAWEEARRIVSSVQSQMRGLAERSESESERSTGGRPDDDEEVASSDRSAGRAEPGPSAAAGEDKPSGAVGGEQSAPGRDDGEPSSSASGLPLRPSSAGKHAPSATSGYRPGSSEEAWVSTMVSGCVSLLITLYHSSEWQHSEGDAQAAIENALQVIKPHTGENEALYEQIQGSISTLKRCLLRASST